jgi:hypothetical protein
MFIPESLRKKTEDKMSKILGESQDTRFKMQVITAEGRLIEADWSVLVLLDNFKLPSGMILSIKN